MKLNVEKLEKTLKHNVLIFYEEKVFDETDIKSINTKINTKI